MRGWVAALVVALGLCAGAMHAKADDGKADANGWQDIACDRSPITVNVTATERCRMGPNVTQTREACLTRQFSKVGQMANGFYLAYAVRLETGMCYMYEVSDTAMVKQLKAFNPKGSDWGDTHRLGDSFVVDFKLAKQLCFGFTNHGGQAGFGANGVRSYIIAQFCTTDASGYDDDAKRNMIAAVKLAP